MFGRMPSGKDMNLMNNFFTTYTVGRFSAGFLVFFLLSTPLLFSYFFLSSAVDHQWDGERFATAGAQVDIWNHNRF